MFLIERAHTLIWCNSDHTVFECFVKYAHFTEELPTGVNSDDPNPHIKELWQKGNLGEYGPIAEYVQPETPPAPPEPTYQQRRAAAYPSVGDQLDALWKGGEAASAMKTIIQSVKDSIPKVNNS